MIKFALILTLWPVGDGPFEQYAVDTGLTGEDCIEALVSLAPAMVPRGELSCVIDPAPADAQ